MQPHSPWLSQGDLFEDLPLPVVEADPEGELPVKSSVRRGPALLLTHGCEIDKATNAQTPKTRRLHFLPLVAVQIQDPNRQAVLRRRGLQPYEVLYLGECGRLGESFAILSEAIYLPTALFDPYLDPWVTHEDAVPGDVYLTPRQNADRVGRIEDQELELLHDKMNAFWTRRLPEVDASIVRTGA